ncbi:MAG: MFS transporter [Oscillospiraceae bacterium]
MNKKYLGYESPHKRNLFLLCWVAYFSTYICRLNFSAVMPELQKGEVFSESQIALVSSAFFICYGAFQFVSGILGDKLDTRLMVFWGLLISSVSNILIFFNHSFYSLLFLWAINGIVQSMVWSPILKIASVNFNEVEKKKFGIDISTTVPIGTLLSYGISLLTLIFLPWQYVFLTCGLTELLISFYWFIGTKNLKQSDAEKEKSKALEVAPMSAKKTIKILLAGGLFFLLIPIAIQGTLKDSVTQWIPTFLGDAFGSKTTFSLALTMILPIINVTGAYFAKAVDKKVKNEITTSLIFFVISAVFLTILMLFGSKNIIIALISMAAITNCMFAINVMLITMVPLAFASTGRVSTISGFLNAMAYIGCGILNIFAGKILEISSSWSVLFIMWLILAVIAIFVSAISVPLWKKTKAKKL